MIANEEYAGIAPGHIITPFSSTPAAARIC